MASERIERAAYSVRDLQQLYGIGRSTLYRDIAAGRLVARKFGSRTLFLSDDVTRWIKDRLQEYTRAA